MTEALIVAELLLDPTDKIKISIPDNKIGGNKNQLHWKRNNVYGVCNSTAISGKEVPTKSNQLHQAALIAGARTVQFIENPWLFRNASIRDRWCTFCTKICSLGVWIQGEDC
jgi:hypothetical protein